MPEKRFDVLIEAVAALPGARLLIVGEGRSRRQLESLANALAPGRVTFRGNMPQTELRVTYAASRAGEFVEVALTGKSPGKQGGAPGVKVRIAGEPQI